MTKKKIKRNRNAAAQPPAATTAPILAQAVAEEIQILQEELTKAREAGDAAAICRFAETIANVKAKSMAMSCQMDATLRKILTAGVTPSVPMPPQPAPNGEPQRPEPVEDGAHGTDEPADDEVSS